jgi:hypothetical protein
MATATPKKTSTAVAAAIDGTRLTLAFSNGESLTLDSATLSQEIYHAAAMHGLKQKLVDGAAIARDPETGRTATIVDKFNAVREIFDRITGANGETPAWNKIRGNGESGNAKGGLLVRAMMRITTKSKDEITAYLDKLSKEEVAALRKNPRVVEMIRLIQAENTDTSKVDTDALLDGLMEGHNGDTDEEEGEDGDSDSDSDETDAEREARTGKDRRGAGRNV